MLFELPSEECETSGSHSGEYEVFWNALQFGRNRPTFQRCLLPVSIIALMMKAVGTSETSVNFYETTRCSIPKESSSMGNGLI
jgi:hypothetical protein